MDVETLEFTVDIRMSFDAGAVAVQVELVKQVSVTQTVSDRVGVQREVVETVSV